MTTETTTPHCEWCSAKRRVEPLSLAREGKTNRQVADLTGIPYGTLATLLCRARRKGCIPVVNIPLIHGASTVRISMKCEWCKEQFYAKRQGAHYCSDPCSLAARRAGMSAYEPQDRAALGPAKPFFEPDHAAIYGRALRAAKDGVLYTDLEDRFGVGVARKAYAQAQQERPKEVCKLPKWFGDLSRLPLGPPL